MHVGNKLNSFRGGPIKATANVVDTSSIINRQGHLILKDSTVAMKYAQPRPNSSKPANKGIPELIATANEDLVQKSSIRLSSPGATNLQK